MRYWWVNQNQTYNFEVPGGFLWSPKNRSDGGKHYFYDTMTEVQPGDVVFSFAESQIKAIGIIQHSAITAPKPNFRTAGSNWSDVGWYVEVEFSVLPEGFKPKDHMELIAPLLSEKYAPLQKNGNGLQGVYLTELSDELAKALLLLSKVNFSGIQHELAPLVDSESEYEINLEIDARKIEGDLEKIQLTKSRRGQGIFKANVRLVEDHCRVTGVTNVKHLRASHIKPWAVSDNDEKLDGFNGLLLSPHVDHLFDRGFISFRDTGDILVSKELNPMILDQWSISKDRNVGVFRSNHSKYLEYHRDSVFQG